MTLERWHRLTVWPLVVGAVAFLAAYAWEVLGDLHGAADTVPSIVMNVAWALFIADYLVSLWLARPRGHWFLTHLFDLALVVLPVLQPLRLVRPLLLLRALQASVGRKLRGRIIAYAATGVLMMVLVGSLAILDAEREAPGSSIQTFPNAVWWTCVTITTVGYGDLAPATFDGRLIAIGLMAGGIILIGVVTGTLASWIIDRVRESDEAHQAATRAQIRELEGRIDRLLTVQERMAERLDHAERRAAQPSGHAGEAARD